MKKEYPEFSWKKPLWLCVLLLLLRKKMIWVKWDSKVVARALYKIKVWKTRMLSACVCICIQNSLVSVRVQHAVSVFLWCFLQCVCVSLCETWSSCTVGITIVQCVGAEIFNGTYYCLLQNYVFFVYLESLLPLWYILQISHCTVHTLSLSLPRQGGCVFPVCLLVGFLPVCWLDLWKSYGWMFVKFSTL